MSMQSVWQRVEAPPVVPRPFGLFSVAPPTSPADPHWQGGVVWDSTACTPALYTTEPCVDGGTAPGPKTPAGCTPNIDFKPFAVYVLLQRSGLGTDAVVQLAEQALSDAEQTGVEKRLWAALQGESTEGAATTPGNALGLVEAALGAGYNGLGVIHMPRQVATLLGADYLVQSGGQLQTILGTPVVAGGGYGVVDATTGVSTAPAIYGTGAVVVRRGTTDTFPAMNQSVNDLFVLAERTYLVGWDCFTVGRLVTVP